MLGILSITGILSLVLIGLVLSMAANERRREMGVLKALGADTRVCLRSVSDQGWHTRIGRRPAWVGPGGLHCVPVP